MRCIHDVVWYGEALSKPADAVRKRKAMVRAVAAPNPPIWFRIANFNLSFEDAL
jgi:hypothetical protein